MGLYAYMRKNEIKKFSGKWMELEKILSEVTQPLKDKHSISSLLCASWLRIFKFVSRLGSLKRYSESWGREILP